jgi:antiviral helicase SKI2
MLPKHITLILLSATVPNTKEFAEWVGRTKQKDIYVISTAKRPVPLEHYLYVDKELLKLVDSKKTFLTAAYKGASDSLNPKKDSSKKDVPSSRGGKQVSKSNVGRPTVGKNMFMNMVTLLKKKNLLPVIIFSFSKRKCQEYAQSLGNLDLTGGTSEKSEIHVFFQRSLSCLKGSDRELPQVLQVKDMVSRGIAVHHGGLLPILKEVVEILFTRGLVKVLFATETFAMGVNAPAKSVVFSSIRKHDGSTFRDLLPGEYTQMSGRAGRRGLDDTGMVIISCMENLPEQLRLNRMILGTPTKLESQFKITYNMILNLLRIEAIKVEDMIKRSFSENSAQKELPQAQEEHEKSTNLLNSMKQLECVICKDIDHYYTMSSQILTLGYQSMEHIINSPSGSKALSPGRIIVVNTVFFRNVVGVILTALPTQTVLKDETRAAALIKNYQVLLLADTCSEVADAIPATLLNFTDGKPYVIETIPHTAILTITSASIRINSLDWSDASKSDIVAFSVFDIVRHWKQSPEHDWSKIRQVDFQQLYREKTDLLAGMLKCECMKCPNLPTHYALIHRQRILQQQVTELAHKLSDQNLELIPEYQDRVELLQTMHFIENSVVQIKGRVACEINTCDELVLTELILNNFWNDYDAAETVALLSTLVFQEKSEVEPTLTPNLSKGVKGIQDMAAKLSEMQKRYHIQQEPQIRIGLVEAVYEWALGLEFKKITSLTDIYEGFFN